MTILHLLQIASPAKLLPMMKMMKSSRSSVLAAVVLLATTLSYAQDWAKSRLDASPRHHEYVPLKHDGRTVQAFVVYPEVKEKAPVVIMIHEIFGLSDWAKEMADELAAEGFIVVAPDLLSGMAPGGGRTSDFPGDKVTEAVSHLNPDQVTADLNAAADYALKLPSANGKLFVAGFCWGGGQTFRFATNRSGLSAAFVFYGPPPGKDAMGGFFEEQNHSRGLRSALLAKREETPLSPRLLYPDTRSLFQADLNA